MTESKDIKRLIKTLATSLVPGITEAYMRSDMSVDEFAAMFRSVVEEYMLDKFEPKK